MENRQYKNTDNARVVGGLLLVGGGAALLMRNLGYLQLPYWLFTWPMILVIVGIYSGVKHRFSNSGWIIMIAIGLFFLVDKAVPGIRLEPAFWPAVIIGAGLIFLLRPRRKKLQDEDFAGSDEAGSYPVSITDQQDYIRMDSVFSGINKTIVSKNFQGGKVSCVFGGAEIDLLQADINGSVLLKVEVVFGGVKMLVPSNWTIHSDIDGAFRSLEDKRKFNPAVVPDPAKVLVIKGSVVFGGIEIKSY